MQNDLNRKLEALKSNPIFYFSLSSKELFHSNFFEWLCNDYPVEMYNILKKFIDGDKLLKLTSCKREDKNIDLKINFRGKNDPEQSFEIWIENKVKSLPKIEQLERYLAPSNELKNVIGVLLSLAEPQFDLPDSWKYYSYEQYKNELESQFLNKKDDNNIYLIEQYIKLIDMLITLEKSITITGDQLYNFRSKDGIYPKLEKLRMHDFYLKKYYEKLSLEMLAETKKNFPGITCKFSGYIAEEDTIRTDYDMTRGTGLITIAYCFKENFNIGIQIQDNAYKMFIEDKAESHQERLITIFKKLVDNELWFNFSSFKGYSVRPIPGGNKEYKKYGDNYIYKSIQLNDKGNNNKIFTIGELITIVIGDIRNIIDNKSFYEDLLSKKR